MSNFDKIEREIVVLARKDWEPVDPELELINRHDIEQSMRLLLDVAEAAETHTNSIEQGFAAEIRPDIARARLNKALTKLREHCDD